ncbi:hypothetical protein XELAEV_18016122mg [Xenopus laevis]|uniref:Uncharacterized protein n=1 Tax=Xenopus laevis TaxID=8355 RepID=A0A974DKH1_XENLA|nr:hypothetical protein XELAEV_18016122mg [Xenopus laevis]
MPPIDSLFLIPLLYCLFMKCLYYYHYSCLFTMCCLYCLSLCCCLVAHSHIWAPGFLYCPSSSPSSAYCCRMSMDNCSLGTRNGSVIQKVP